MSPTPHRTRRGLRVSIVPLALAILSIAVLLGPAPASAGLGIEPYLASRHPQGDAGELYDTGLATGLAFTFSFPVFPLRPRACIDFSEHDAKTPGDDKLSGNVMTLDAVFDLGAGLFVPYLLAGIGVSNLEADPSSGEVKSPYESGAGIWRFGAGLRAGLGKRLSATGEVDYAQGSEGNDLTTGKVGNLELLDVRLGLLIGF